MDAILNKIKDFADDAHGTQMRKYTPERYIVHPIRVMEICRIYDARISMLAAALLHDVIEDTPVNANHIAAFLQTLMDADTSAETLTLVVEMTDVYVKADFPEWNRRQRKDKELERILQTSGDAQTIKYADIIDNTREIVRHDPGFAQRYLSECLIILENANQGHPQLHKMAMRAVRENLAQLRC